MNHHSFYGLVVAYGGFSSSQTPSPADFACRPATPDHHPASLRDFLLFEAFFDSSPSLSP